MVSPVDLHSEYYRDIWSTFNTVDTVICGRPTSGQMSPTDKISGTDCSVMLMDRETMVTSGQLSNVECGPVSLDESD